MKTPELNASYMCQNNTVYLTWMYDEEATAYEIYKDGNLLTTIPLEELDEPFIFLNFPRNRHLRNTMILSKMYTDTDIQKFKEYTYKVRPIYNEEPYNFSNEKLVVTE